MSPKDKHEHKHKDKDLETWAERDKDSQHPSEFKGPLAEVDTSPQVEAAKREKWEHEHHRTEEKAKAKDKDSQHPGEFLGPLEEVDD